MDKIWWNQVTNASLFVKEIISNLVNEKSVVLHLPNNLPWYNTLRGLVEEEIEARISKYRLNFLDDCTLEPGEIIMTEFCKKEKRDNYRPAIGYEKFLADCDDIVLNERIVWITNISTSRYEIWVEFIRKYLRQLGKHRQGGLFILEIKSDEIIPLKRGICRISFSEKIGAFDISIFNMLTASITCEDIYMKRYLAELVTTINKSDIELSSHCTKHKYYTKFLENPYQCLCTIASKEERSNGQKFEISVTKEDVEKRMWETQIKIIFPLIEDYREYLIEHNIEQIKLCLPFKTNHGEEYNIPSEVEIGTLCFWSKNEKISISDIERERLEMFKNTRNDLAHLRILDIAKIQKCFDVIMDLK